MESGYTRWLNSKKTEQITIDDEFARQRNPDWEWTREEKIANLLKRADQDDKAAKWWAEHHNTQRAQHLRNCAAGARSLAAMLRR